eukprot:scaffold293771_cov39-Tisochrysis_lutea.AAC.1
MSVSAAAATSLAQTRQATIHMTTLRPKAQKLGTRLPDHIYLLAPPPSLRKGVRLPPPAPDMWKSVQSPTPKKGEKAFIHYHPKGKG